MSNQEYSFNDKNKIIDEIIKPFFSDQNFATKNENDYLFIATDCIKRVEIIKNPIFQTFNISFSFSADDPYVQSKITSFENNEQSFCDVFKAVISNFDETQGYFSKILSIASLTTINQSFFDLQSLNNGFLNDNFYNKIKEKLLEQNKKFVKSDFDYLNSLCFYYILKLLTDSLNIQVTPPTGTPVILNINKNVPILAPIPLDIVKDVKESILIDFNNDLNDFKTENEKFNNF